MTRHKSAARVALKTALKPERESRAQTRIHALTRRRIAAAEFTRPHAVALLPAATLACARARSTAAPTKGSRTMAPRPPSTARSTAPEAAPRGAARFNSRTRHLRAGRLAAPLAQTRRGPHDGDETKSCGVFE